MKIVSYKLKNSKGETDKVVLEEDRYRSTFEYNILKYIDSDEIAEYAERNLDMIDEDECDCECNITDFTVAELKERLEDLGYEMSSVNEDLDNIDSKLLDEITVLFYAADWKGRREMLEKLKS